MQTGIAIMTRYAGPTATKGGRIIATCKRDSQTVYRAVVAYDHSLSTAQNHATAAAAIIAKTAAPWRLLAAGSTPDGYSFVAGV